MPEPLQGREPGFFLTPASRPYPDSAIPDPGPPVIVADPTQTTWQARQRALIGRGGHVHLPNPIITAGPAVLVVTHRQVRDNAFRFNAFWAGRGRAAPIKAHVAKPVVAPPVVVIPEPAVAILQAVKRALNRGGVPKPQVARAVLAAPRAPPLLLVGQALRRPLVGRTVPKPHLAPPVVATQVFPPLAPGRTVLVRSRWFRGRTRLAKPVVAPGGPPLAPAKIVSQAVRRALTRREAGKLHIPNPIITPASGPPPVAPGTFTFVRNKLTRGRVTVPNPLIIPSVAGAAPVATRPLVVTQVPERSLRPRPAPRPHLAAPIVGPNPGLFDDSILLLAAVNVSQASERAQTRRNGPKPHLAAPVVTQQATTPVARGRFVYQAIARALVKRGAPEPHVAPPVVGPGAGFVGSKATQVGQAVARALVKRGAPEPHVPVLPVGQPPLPPAKVVLVRSRWFRGHAKTAPPVITQIVVAPFPPAVIVSQASERGTLQRRVPAPHVAEPIVAPGGPPLRPATVVTVRGRWFRGRTYLAPPVVQQVVVAPLPPAVVVSQVAKRSTLQRSAPKPHLAAGIVAPGAGFVGSRAKSVLVRARWFAGRTRTAPPVVTALQAPFEPAVIISQAQKRALLGRGVAKPHVAAPIQPVAPVRPGLVVGQAVRRAVVKRGVPAPHVARPVVGPGAGFIGSRAVRVLQAIRRALIGRTPPAPHTAPPRPPLPIPDTNPTIIVGRERHNITGTEDFGIVGRERHNVDGTEDTAITGRERWPM